MAGHTDAGESASSAATSQRPPLSYRESDSQSDTTSHHSAGPYPHHRARHQQAQRQHHVGGRHHARVPSSKALHKQLVAPAPKLNRRITSPGDETPEPSSALSSHRRAASEVKLARGGSGSTLSKLASHTSLKRNHSHADVSKRSRSSDKLKHTASRPEANRVTGSKSAVHFDLGDDDQEDEWVDASGSNSPYLSRKGSLNSSAQSSLRPTPSASNSRAESPEEPSRPQPSTPERERIQRREYLTTRLLRRTPSHGAPPQVTSGMAHGAPSKLSPELAHRDTSTVSGGANDELTSRFVEAPASGLTSEGSFYNPIKTGSLRSEDLSGRPHSISHLPQPEDGLDGGPLIDRDDSALVPKPARGTAAPSAEASRTQQKLNLQRASSVLEPSQAMSHLPGSMGSGHLIVGRPGYDGASSRDLRVGKLLERTGMEYLVVRRYQNPIARSLNRLYRPPGMEKAKRIPRNSSTLDSKRSLEHRAIKHARNTSMPESRRPVTPKTTAPSVGGSAAASSFNGDEDGRLNERLSGSSLVGDAEDALASLLRNLWEKPLELSASTD